MAEDARLEIILKILTDRFGRDEANNALSDIKKGLEEGKKHAKDFNIHGKETREIFHKLNELVPGLGRAMHAAFNPKAMNIGLLIVAFTGLMELLKKMREEVEKLNKAQSEMAVVTWQASVKAMRDLEQAEKDRSKSLADSIVNLNHYKEAEERASKAIEARYDMLKKLAGEDKPRIEALSREEADRKLKQLDVNRQDALQHRWDAQAVLEAAQGRLRATAGGPGALQAAQAQQWLTTHKDDLQKAQEAHDKAVRESGGMSSAQLRERAGFARGTMMENVLLNQAKDIDHLEEVRSQQKAAEAAVAAHATAMKGLEQEESKASTAVSNFIKSVEEATKAIEDFKQATALSQHTADALKLQAAGMKPESVLGGTALRFIEVQEQRARDIADARQRATAEGRPQWAVDRMFREGRTTVGGMDAAGDQITRDMIAALRMKGNTEYQIHQFFLDMLDAHKTTTQKLAEVMAALKQSKQQARSLAVQ